MSATSSVFYRLPHNFILRNRSSANTNNFVYRELHNHPEIRAFVRDKMRGLIFELYSLAREQHLERYNGCYEKLYLVHDMFPIDIILKDAEKDVAKMVEAERLREIAQTYVDEENKENAVILTSRPVVIHKPVVIVPKHNRKRTYKITYKHAEGKPTVVYKRVSINKPCCI